VEGFATGLFASPGQSGSAAAQSFLTQSVERIGELGAERREFTFDSLGPADHYMVGAGVTLRRDDLPSKRAQATFEPVANDRSADLLGHREANPHRLIRILAMADEQDESGSRHATAAVRGEEVGALLDRG